MDKSQILELNSVDYFPLPLSLSHIQVSLLSTSRRLSPAEDFLLACSWLVNTSRTGSCWQWLTGWSSSSIFPLSVFMTKATLRRQNQSVKGTEDAHQGHDDLKAVEFWILVGRKVLKAHSHRHAAGKSTSKSNNKQILNTRLIHDALL